MYILMRTTYRWGHYPRAIDALLAEFSSIVSFVDDQDYVLWTYNAHEELCLFGRLCALDVIDQWDAPTVVREWLETGEEDLRKEAFVAIRKSSTIVSASLPTRWAALAAESTAEHDSKMRSIVSSTLYAARATTQNVTNESILAARSKQNLTLESLLYSGAIRRELT